MTNSVGTRWRDRIRDEDDHIVGAPDDDVRSETEHGDTLERDDGPDVPFEFFGDPLSDISFGNANVTPAGDTRKFTGIEAVNLTNQTLHEIGLFVPFVWSEVPNTTTVVPLTWSNEKNGWFTPDFNGTAQSLLVTLRIVTVDGAENDEVEAGEVAADATLTGVFGPTSLDIVDPVTGLPDPAPFPVETLRPQDEVPFVELGSFAPHEVKTFDLLFTYEWGEGSLSGTLPTFFYVATLAPVLEPEESDEFVLHGHAAQHDSVF